MSLHSKIPPPALPAVVCHRNAFAHCPLSADGRKTLPHIKIATGFNVQCGYSGVRLYQHHDATYHRQLKTEYKPLRRREELTHHPLPYTAHMLALIFTVCLLNCSLFHPELKEKRSASLGNVYYHTLKIAFAHS